MNNSNAMQKTKDAKSMNGAKTKSLSNKKMTDNIDPEHLTLWQHPLITLNYFMKELLIDCFSLAKKIFRHKKTVLCLVFVVSLFFLLSRISGPQQQVNNHFLLLF